MAYKLPYALHEGGVVRHKNFETQPEPAKPPKKTKPAKKPAKSKK